MAAGFTIVNRDHRDMRLFRALNSFEPPIYVLFFTLAGIHLNIEPYYTPLVRTNSEFWNASGIHVNAGLLSGLELDSESLESVLAGGIAFATPDNEDMGDAAAQDASFELHDKYRNSWLNWQPKIPLGPAG